MYCLCYSKNITSQFLQSVSIALLCKPCTSYDRDVRLSVRHTLVLSENDASQDHEIFTDGQHNHSTFRDKKSSRNSKGSPQARELNESGVGKICNFQPISRRISETDQSYYKSLIGSRIHPFDWCQNQRPWMTLNGRYAICCRKDASSNEVRQPSSCMESSSAIFCTLFKDSSCIKTKSTCVRDTDVCLKPRSHCARRRALTPSRTEARRRASSCVNFHTHVLGNTQANYMPLACRMRGYKMSDSDEDIALI